jgi:hypothetical protein
MSYLRSPHHLIMFTSISGVFEIDNVVYYSAQVIWELTRCLPTFQTSSEVYSAGDTNFSFLLDYLHAYLKMHVCN